MKLRVRDKLRIFTPTRSITDSVRIVCEKKKISDGETLNYSPDPDKIYITPELFYVRVYSAKE